MMSQVVQSAWPHSVRLALKGLTMKEKAPLFLLQQTIFHYTQ